MIRFMFALSLLIVSSANAKTYVDLRCFSSPNDKINIELRMYQDDEIGWVGGQVRYKQSQEYIPITHLKTESLEDYPDRPSEFEHTWLEIVEGEINGKYIILSQGANVYGFSYTNKQSGKTVDLSQSKGTDENGNCNW